MWPGTALRKPRSNHRSPVAATPDQRSAPALHETPTIIFLAMNDSSLSGKRSGGNPRRVIIIIIIIIIIIKIKPQGFSRADHH